MLNPKKKTMRKNVLLSILILSCATLGAQTYLQQPNLSNRTDKPVNFWDVQLAFQNYWSGQTPSEEEGENAEEGGYQQFKRWEAFMMQRTFPSGNFPSPEILYSEYLKYKTQYGNARMMTANWSFFGPDVVPGNGGGAGRINCMEFDPNNANIMWVGAACGGLWKTTDGGATWTSNTDLLPSLSISEIVIDPTNPNNMYIATGDKYGIYWQYEVWGHYSAGVLKSTDGGVTWNSTGMNYQLDNIVLIQRLIMDPASPTTLYAATNSGIYKTTDGGANWNNIRNGSFCDIEMKPGTASTLYACDTNQVIVSTNSGGTWNTAPTVIGGGGRISIAVTPANANAVYVWSNNGGFYYSNNSATSFTVRTDPVGDAGPYGYYDYVLEVSPVNENIVFTGGLNIARSTNGGSSWTTVSNWAGWPAPDYSHADNHAQKFAPGSQTTIYSCNDGGIFKSTDQGNTWTDLSAGIAIKQYYRIGGSAITPSLIYGGAQDNGTDRVLGANSATQVNGADGEECLVDFTNDNIVFVSSQGGYFLRSTNGGVTFNALSAFGCDWTSPIIMDGNNHDVMYMGGSDVFKSTDNGLSWVNTSNGGFDGGCLYSLEICAGNSNHVYAATFGHIYKTTNAGGSWTDVTANLPVGSAAISGITISNSNPSAVWVTLSGFSSGNKVYYSSNGGGTWTNYSGTLPNVPANCIEYQNNTNDLLYLGTDLGVFYRDATMSDWAPYNTGLPNVVIDELEINYSISKLRAATFGRGIWESDLQISTLLAIDASTTAMIAPPTTTCDTVITPIITIRNSGINTITSVDVFYRIDLLPWQQYSYTGTLASSATANITLNTYTLAAGAHTLKAYTTNPNASGDMNLFNDTIVRNFTINPATTASTPPPIVEGFVSTTFPPTGWSIENSSSLLSRTTAVGGYGNSANSVMVDFFNIQNGTDELVTMYVDFSNAIPPIRLYFDLAYAPYGAGYNDSLVLETYADCPGISVRKYAKGPNQLATAPPNTNVFTPTASQWRTDTINLDTMAGHAPMKIRFIVKTGYGNQLYLDNINLSANGVGIAQIDAESTFNAYPNPAANTLTIDLGEGQTGANQIVVYDLYGKVVEQTSIRGGASRLTLDVSQWAEGVYLVQVQHNGVVETKRVMIVR
jgi:photosystem II stability/assembly factor-like uncharacterized protein